MANRLSIEACLWIIFQCFPESFVSSTGSELLGNSFSTLHFHVKSSNARSNEPTGNRTPLRKGSLSAGGGWGLNCTGWSRESGPGGWFTGQPLAGYGGMAGVVQTQLTRRGPAPDSCSEVWPGTEEGFVQIMGNYAPLALQGWGDKSKTRCAPNIRSASGRGSL